MDITILPDGITGFSDMIIIMTAETTIINRVTDIIGIGISADEHFREYIIIKSLNNSGNGFFDIGQSVESDFRLFLFIKFPGIILNESSCRIRTGKWIQKNIHGHFFDVRKIFGDIT
jgi:hypothetical protein